MSKPAASPLSSSSSSPSSSSASSADDIAALPSSLPDLQALHVKLTKKIAQLTKVIVLLNTQNDEHSYQLACIQQQHNRQLAQQQTDLQQQLTATLSRIQSLHADELTARDNAIQALQTELIDEKRELQTQWREREAALVERVREERAKEEVEVRRLREEMDTVRLTLTSKLHHFNKTIRDLDTATTQQLATEQHKREQEVAHVIATTEERIRQLQRQLLEKDEECQALQKRASDQTVALAGEERARAEMAEVRRMYEGRVKERERDAMELEKKWMSEMQSRKELEDKVKDMTAQWEKQRQDEERTRTLGAQASEVAVREKEEECGRLEAELRGVRKELSDEREEREKSDKEREKGRMKNAEGEAERRRLAAEAKEEQDTLTANNERLKKQLKEKEDRWADEQKRRLEHDKQAEDDNNKLKLDKQAAEARLAELEAKLTAADDRWKDEQKNQKKQAKDQSDKDEQWQRQHTEWIMERQRLGEELQSVREELGRLSREGREKEEAEFADVERRMREMRDMERERMRETRELREKYEEEQVQLEERDRARQQEITDEKAQWEQKERDWSELRAQLTADAQRAGEQGGRLGDELETLRRALQQVESDKARLTVDAADRQRQSQQAQQQWAEKERALTASLDSLRRDMQIELQRRQQLEAQLTQAQSSSQTTAQLLQVELSKAQAALNDTQKLLKASEDSNSIRQEHTKKEKAAWQVQLTTLEEQLALSKLNGDTALRQQGEALEGRLAQMREQLDRVKAMMDKEKEAESEKWKSKLATAEAALTTKQGQHQQAAHRRATDTGSTAAGRPTEGEAGGRTAAATTTPARHRTTQHTARHHCNSSCNNKSMLVHYHCPVTAHPAHQHSRQALSDREAAHRGGRSGARNLPNSS